MSDSRAIMALLFLFCHYYGTCMDLVVMASVSGTGGCGIDPKTRHTKVVNKWYWNISLVLCAQHIWIVHWIYGQVSAKCDCVSFHLSTV